MCHPLREDVSWNTLFPVHASASLVILFVRMWVEMTASCLFLLPPFGHPLREDVSWNDWKPESKERYFRHPLREDVSWNVFGSAYSGANAVILFVRMWVEISMRQGVRQMRNVILFVRMWVEISHLNQLNTMCPVILFVRMWVEIWVERKRRNHTGSSSSWGCELKWCNSWVSEDSCSHPLREDVSWNVMIPTQIYLESVILFVRMWVEISWKYVLLQSLLSSSSWGCELKCITPPLTCWFCQSSSSWGCELKYLVAPPLFRGEKSSSSWGCELKCRMGNYKATTTRSSSSWGCELK